MGKGEGLLTPNSKLVIEFVVANKFPRLAADFCCKSYSDSLYFYRYEAIGRGEQGKYSLSTLYAAN